MHLIISSSEGIRKVLQPGQTGYFLGNLIEIELASITVIAATQKMSVEELLKLMPVIGQFTHWPRFRIPERQPDYIQLGPKHEVRRGIPSHFWNWHQLECLPFHISSWDKGENPQEITICMEE